MKKYFISVLIPYLILYLSGCYSMQKVTKDEFLQTSDYPELYVKTKEKEYSFEEGNYTFQNDTIYGTGKSILLINDYLPFEGRISVNDVEKIEKDKMNNASDTTNLIVKTNELDLNGLLRKMGTGLLVTELMGDGINIVTGDYSRGIFGYWVENGAIQYPVTGVTIAGNLKDMLLNIVAVGNDIDYRSNILTGSILLDKMTVAGS